MIALTGYTGGLCQFTVAEGGTLEAPQDFSGWTVTGAEGHDIKFRLKGSCLTLRIRNAGTQFILR